MGASEASVLELARMIRRLEDQAAAERAASEAAIADLKRRLAEVEALYSRALGLIEARQAA